MIVKRKRTFPSFRTEEESFLTFMRILTFLAKSSPTKLGIGYVKTWVEEVVIVIEEVSSAWWNGPMQSL